MKMSKNLQIEVVGDSFSNVLYKFMPHNITINKAREIDANFRPYYFISFLAFNLVYWTFLIYATRHP